jgi:clan AA aspartic protease (TIGR02281 family)
MIQIDPKDRPLYLAKRRRPIGLIIMTTFVVIIGLGGSFFYWQVSSTYSDVYRQLDIAPLPLTVEIEPKIYDQVSKLSREPCYRDAILGLSDALLEAGYPRESATSLQSFVNRCNGSDDDELLIHALDAWDKTGDYSAVLRVADQLVKIDPANPQYRYWRGNTFEQLKVFPKALSDYTAALQLMGSPNNIAGSQFYDVARMYAELGRYCDAIAPIETFISFDPVERRTPQTTQLISEYAQKGSCDTHFARGVGRVPILNTGGVRTISVSINGVPGNFILDTGAEYVAVTTDFSARAKINIDTQNQMPMKTAGGFTAADVGYANIITVGNAQADGVVVAVIHGTDPFGGHLDGLLGMSFIARFNMVVSQDGIQLTAIALR